MIGSVLLLQLGLFAFGHTGAESLPFSKVETVLQSIRHRLSIQPESDGGVIELAKGIPKHHAPNDKNNPALTGDRLQAEGVVLANINPQARGCIFQGQRNVDCFNRKPLSVNHVGMDDRHDAASRVPDVDLDGILAKFGDTRNEITGLGGSKKFDALRSSLSRSTRGPCGPSCSEQSEGERPEGELVPFKGILADDVSALSGVRLYQSSAYTRFVLVSGMLAMGFIFFWAWQLRYRTLRRSLVGGGFLLCGFGVLGLLMAVA